MIELDLLEGLEEYGGYGFEAIDDNQNVHFRILTWEGYISDIFGEPDLNGDGWSGFTKIYQECIIDDYSEENPYIIKNNIDFYNDLLKYKNLKLIEESKTLYNALLEMVKCSIELNLEIKVWSE